jgi:hypothetical protein
MKRLLYIFVWTLLTGQNTFSQDSLPSKGQRWDASVFAGAGFKEYFGSKYIPPTEPSSDDPFQAHIYDGFTKKPSFFFDAGIIFSLRISEHFRLASGISYAFRKTIYERSMDSAKNNFTYTSMENIKNVLEFSYSFNNLEIPLFLEYSFRNATVYAGFRMSLFSYRSAGYSYVMVHDAFNPAWYTSEKKLREFEMPLKLYPSIQVSYQVRIGKISIHPFLGFDFFEIDLKKFYFHIQTSPGVNIIMNGPTVENCYFLQAGVLYHLPCFR